MSKNLVNFKTPRGTLEWVNVSGEGKENLSGRMQYIANLVLSKEDADAMEAKLKDFWEANKPKEMGKRPPKSLGIYYRDFLKDENGEPVYGDDGKKAMDKDGPRYLKFSTATTWPDGKPKVVKIYNGKGKQVQIEANIGNGSVGVIAGAMDIYENRQGKNLIDAGVTLYLDGIQVIKLVEYSNDPGFESYDDAEEIGATDFDNIGSEVPAQEPAGKGVPKL